MPVGDASGGRSMRLSRSETRTARGSASLAPGVASLPAGGIFKSAAAEVLRRSRRLMSTGEICRLALEWGLLTCSGKTPEATMASSLYGDVKRLERRSVFVRPREGLFGLREWLAQDGGADQIEGLVCRRRGGRPPRGEGEGGRGNNSDSVPCQGNPLSREGEREETSAGASGDTVRSTWLTAPTDEAPRSARRSAGTELGAGASQATGSSPHAQRPTQSAPAARCDASRASKAAPAVQEVPPRRGRGRPPLTRTIASERWSEQRSSKRRRTLSSSDEEEDDEHDAPETSLSSFGNGASESTDSESLGGDSGADGAELDDGRGRKHPEDESPLIYSHHGAAMGPDRSPDLLTWKQSLPQPASAAVLLCSELPPETGTSGSSDILPTSATPAAFPAGEELPAAASAAPPPLAVDSARCTADPSSLRRVFPASGRASGELPSPALPAAAHCSALFVPPSSHSSPPRNGAPAQVPPDESGEDRVRHAFSVRAPAGVDATACTRAGGAGPTMHALGCTDLYLDARDVGCSSAEDVLTLAAILSCPRLMAACKSGVMARVCDAEAQVSDIVAKWGAAHPRALRAKFLLRRLCTPLRDVYSQLLLQRWLAEGPDEHG